MENTEAINEAISNFNNVDFEHLNQAIEDLAKVIEPLAKLVGAFG